MTNANPQEPNDVLQRAESALRMRASGATPPPALLDRTLRSLQSLPSTPTRRFWTMKKIFGTSLAGAIAASVAVAFIWTILQHNARFAFADVLQNVRQVQSVKMSLRDVFQMGGETINATGTMYIDEASHRMRQEFHDMPSGEIINVFDFKIGKGITLTPRAKTAIRLDITHMSKEKAPNDLLDRLKKLQDAPAKDLGEKEIDGRLLHGFHFSDLTNETTTETTLWADPKSKMPIIVEQTVRNGFLPMTLTMSDFQWNSPVDDSLLTLEIPAGYSISDAPMDLGKPTQQELVAALKASTRLNDGKFPEGLTVRQLARSMANTLPESSQIQQKMSEHGGDMLIVARGWAFISNPDNGSDWNWAGTNVPLGEKDHPILWYKPAGKSSYTIINADLSLQTDAPKPTDPFTPIDTTPSSPPAN